MRSPSPFPLFGTKPVVFNVQNSTKPAPGQPQLISFDDANTMFHEFGHALHGLLSNQTYPSLSGANTARDFVEFPSQFNENWMTDPKVFANFAKHYKTGETIPMALVEKMADHFSNPNTPYPALPWPAYGPHFNDYAHLERIAEWSTAGGGDE